MTTRRRGSPRHSPALVIATLLALAGACASRDTDAQVGMTRQSVLESSKSGLPKRQEQTAEGKTDFYDWGWVRYDNQERVVEVYRRPPYEPAVSNAEVVAEGTRLEAIHRVAVAVPAIEIYKRKWFGRDELVSIDVALLRSRLSDLITAQLKRRFATVIDLNGAAVDATAAAALQRAEDQFRSAIAGDPLNALSSGDAAKEISWSLSTAAQQLGVDAVVLSAMTATVREVPAAPSALGQFRAVPLVLWDERSGSVTCGSFPPPRPIYVPIPIVPPPPQPPPVMATLSAALIAGNGGEILWSQVGSLQGVLKTPDDLTQVRLEQLVTTALPGPPTT